MVLETPSAPSAALASSQPLPLPAAEPAPLVRRPSPSLVVTNALTARQGHTLLRGPPPVFPALPVPSPPWATARTALSAVVVTFLQQEPLYVPPAAQVSTRQVRVRLSVLTVTRAISTTSLDRRAARSAEMAPTPPTMALHLAVSVCLVPLSRPRELLIVRLVPQASTPPAIK